MLENHLEVDAVCVGILGWSHGGLITLMNLFEHPKDYRAGYAGVPVSDLVARMGYKSQGYRDEFSAEAHIGQTAQENVKGISTALAGRARIQARSASLDSNDDER